MGTYAATNEIRINPIPRTPGSKGFVAETAWQLTLPLGADGVSASAVAELVLPEGSGVELLRNQLWLVEDSEVDSVVEILPQHGYETSEFRASLEDLPIEATHESVRWAFDVLRAAGEARRQATYGALSMYLGPNTAHSDPETLHQLRIAQIALQKQMKARGRTVGSRPRRDDGPRRGRLLTR
ncbi:hypothetical protein [Rhodococcus sp. AQ5-07]|uniref:hypothetical protein n=1 Tax=Rhodococcus sp. AQ5-07 TaxID=2054902 RepID=UPI000DBFFFB5|nr:hypothetical protein [Rhodococcus sp. AQ5-07]RAL31165.1 hypothetical protein CVN56_29800 [Rhodococcus sp. AQ5-07]